MQYAFSFDKETTRKIIKGFVHSLMVSALIVGIDGISQLLGTVTFADPFVAGIYVMVCNNVYNIAKEWASGI